jgi:hypothetical protein
MRNTLGTSAQVVQAHKCHNRPTHERTRASGAQGPKCYLYLYGGGKGCVVVSLGPVLLLQPHLACSRSIKEFFYARAKYGETVIRDEHALIGAD